MALLTLGDSIEFSLMLLVFWPLILGWCVIWLFTAFPIGLTIATLDFRRLEAPLVFRIGSILISVVTRVILVGIVWGSIAWIPMLAKIWYCDGKCK
jgi:hypothetical protein